MEIGDQIIKRMQEDAKKRQLETQEINSKILTFPESLAEDEKIAYAEIVQTLKESITYRLSATDTELIWILSNQSYERQSMARI